MDDNKKSDKPPKEQGDYLEEIISEVNRDGHKVYKKKGSQKSSKFTTPVKIAAIMLVLTLLIVLRVFLSQITDSKFSDRLLLQEALEKPTTSNFVSSPVTPTPAPTGDDKILKKETIDISKQQAQEHTEGEVCKQAALLFKDKKQMISKYSPELRFRNIHKKVDGTIYRLRFFYKDGDNGNIPTYLVYKEDSLENEFIVENTPEKKGKLYQEIEKATGDILYDSEAFELQGKNDLFIRYENEKIKELQGFLDIEAQNRFPLDCIY